MHMLGKPKTMQQEIIYDDIIGDIKIFFRDRLTVAREKSINNIILDPGIGFGKTVEHNLEIIKKFDEFKELDCPLLIGTSRKSFIGKITGAKVEERLPGTIVSSTVAIQNGANIVRVHDIPEMKQVIKILEAI
jgi:dihydropteroate synthase